MEFDILTDLPEKLILLHFNQSLFENLVI